MGSEKRSPEKPAKCFVWRPHARDPGSTPPLPLCFLFPVPGLHERTRVRGRVRTNTCAPARAPAPGGRPALRRLRSYPQPGAKARPGRTKTPTPKTETAVLHQPRMPCFPGFAKVRDVCSSPFRPVPWCAGAVVYMPLNVPFCAQRGRGRACRPSVSPASCLHSV